MICGSGDSTEGIDVVSMPMVPGFSVEYKISGLFGLESSQKNEVASFSEKLDLLMSATELEGRILSSIRVILRIVDSFPSGGTSFVVSAVKGKIDEVMLLAVLSESDRMSTKQDLKILESEKPEYRTSACP